jgi:hypothetical protein
MSEEKDIQQKLIQIFLDQLKSQNGVMDGVDVKLLEKALKGNVSSLNDLKNIIL